MSKIIASEAIKRMPPKYHRLPGNEFDILKSEVCDFMMKMPEVRQYVFNTFKNCMEYDPVTHQWHGKNYRPD